MMRNVWLFSALLIITNVVVAAPNGDQKVSKKEYCATVSTLADSIMHGRQGEMRMVDMANHFSKAPESFKGIADLMIDDAYSQPRWNSDKAKNEAKIEFSNKWYKKCLDLRK